MNTIQSKSSRKNRMNERQHKNTFSAYNKQHTILYIPAESSYVLISNDYQHTCRNFNHCYASHQTLRQATNTCTRPFASYRIHLHLFYQRMRLYPTQSCGRRKTKRKKKKKNDFFSHHSLSCDLLFPRQEKVQKKESVSSERKRREKRAERKNHLKIQRRPIFTPFSSSIVVVVVFLLSL